MFLIGNCKGILEMLNLVIPGVSTDIDKRLWRIYISDTKCKYVYFSIILRLVSIIQIHTACQAMFIYENVILCLTLILFMTILETILFYACIRHKLIKILRKCTVTTHFENLCT